MFDAWYCSKNIGISIPQSMHESTIGRMRIFPSYLCQMYNFFHPHLRVEYSVISRLDQIQQRCRSMTRACITPPHTRVPHHARAKFVASKVTLSTVTLLLYYWMTTNYAHELNSQTYHDSTSPA